MNINNQFRISNRDRADALNFENDLQCVLNE